MKITYLEWIDSAGSTNNGWQDIDELVTEYLPIKSAGIIMSEDSDSITIVHSSTKGSFMGDITIPKIAITKRKDFDA